MTVTDPTSPAAPAHTPNGSVSDGLTPVDAATGDPTETSEATTSAPAQFTASIFPGSDQPLSPEFVVAVKQLESALGMPVWLLIQPHEHHDHAQIGGVVYREFFKRRRLLRQSGKIALVIDSPGGGAQSAYQLATLLQRHCGGFHAVVPRYGKSAATLLALGAERLVMGRDAELGPLDAQLFDDDRENWASALDEVQTLERLNVAALEQMDQAMMMLVMRTGKKVESVLPLALKYSTDMMRPLLERIDTVHYIAQSRILRVGEEYATRLLNARYGARAGEIASQLVNGYPEHSFVIDRVEATRLLNLEPLTDEVEEALDTFSDLLVSCKQTVLGTLIEGPNL